VRVLHVITGLQAGGAEQQLRLLLRHLDMAPEVVTEVATLTNPGAVACAIRMDGTAVHHVGMRSNRDPRALPRLARLIHAGRFDIVHTHLYRAHLYGRAAARLAGVPHLVATEHSLGDRVIEGRRISPGIRTLYLAAERLGAVTIAVSAAVARRLEAWGVPSQRIRTIPNGIDAQKYRFDPDRRARLRVELGIPEDGFVIGAVGRLVHSKGVDLVLRAAAGLPGVTALIVGDGPQRARLTALADHLGVDTRFTGEVPDVAPHLSTMDLLVTPSTEETFGMAVVEGLAAGLPVLYAACPALEELPSTLAPGARRVPPVVRALRPAVLEAVARGHHRLPAAPALDHYDIVRLAGQVAELYHRVLARDAADRPHERGEVQPWTR